MRFHQVARGNGQDLSQTSQFTLSAARFAHCLKIMAEMKVQREERKKAESEQQAGCRPPPVALEFFAASGAQGVSAVAPINARKAFKALSKVQ